MNHIPSVAEFAARSVSSIRGLAARLTPPPPHF